MKQPSQSALWLVALLIAAAAATPIIVFRLESVWRHEVILGPDRLSLDLPKGWKGGEVTRGPSDSWRAYMTCPLPVDTCMVMLESRSEAPDADWSPEQILRKEVWIDGDLNYTLIVAEAGPRSLGAEKLRTMECRLIGRGRWLRAMFGCDPDHFDLNRPLLERCARSLRWEFP